MTRTEVDNTLSRIKTGVLEMRKSCGGCAMCETRLRDLEALRQHDEVQAAELERLSSRVAKATMLVEEYERFLRGLAGGACSSPTGSCWHDCQTRGDPSAHEARRTLDRAARALLEKR